MSGLEVTFSLNDRDVAFLRRLIRHSGERARGQDPDAIVAAAANLVSRVREAKPPRYVLEQVDRLEEILALVQDKDWALPPRTHARVLAALSYFSSPHDLIPDRIPGLGYLDDAIMIELVARDLAPELRGYAAYRRYRQTGVQRPWAGAAATKLTDKKRALRARIAAAEAKGSKRLSWLW